MMLADGIPRSGLSQFVSSSLVAITGNCSSTAVMISMPCYPSVVAIQSSRVLPIQTPSFWLRMQAEVDLWEAQHANSREYDKIKLARVA